ncbi:tRNA (adenosine(37)-N6)-threonylcarbamoyltransferase complex transferase subunit TsaD [Blattabacterium cuenoti]|uniref:tRNA (adenosine(37)-N6)-threonylcarbamoyltransferase complex transferase subunit TsaD n=1 Tax=Blattabacterium cuenoti TaxID=1653831 RepID=UPI00163C7435|nr:tRNA (adenosine(37)-N6)-threonylcarbamoyltransferase complex transferase subunit TsaD [Blattabacterium cuenoti]
MKCTKSIIILGIESSCDDTAVSIMINQEVISNIIIHQTIHKQYGGIVPELAAREHDKYLFSTVNKAINIANIHRSQIHAVSVTIGPGLIGSLLVGYSFAKSFSMGLNIPIIGVNHIHAHILSHFINNANLNNSFPKFPFLCLMISGAHTQIIQVNDFFDMNILGTTLDDSIGESLDKIARLLGFSYPGAMWLDKNSKLGNNKKFHFSKPNVKGLNFSFSGLKTQIDRFIKNQLKINTNFIKNNLHNLCASIQKIISEILIEKIILAIQQTNIFRIVLAGGVSANSEITKQFLLLKKHNIEIFIPKKQYTTDNGAMIAIVGLFKLKKKLFNINQPFSKFTPWF